MDDGYNLERKSFCKEMTRHWGKRRERITYCSGKDASRPDAGDCSSNNEGCRGRGSSTDGRSYLEQSNARKKNELGIVDCVEFAEQKLECATGQKIDASVPTNIVERIKFIAYFRNSL